MSTANRLDAFLRQTTSRVLAKILPDHSKRQILFASLAACQPDKTRINKATLRKLNHLMVLSELDSPVEFPLRLSRVVWSGEKGDIVIWSMTQTEEPIETAADKVMNIVPDWLRYGNIKGMREDIIKLIGAQRQQLARTA